MIIYQIIEVLDFQILTIKFVRYSILEFYYWYFSKDEKKLDIKYADWGFHINQTQSATQNGPNEDEQFEPSHQR